MKIYRHSFETSPVPHVCTTEIEVTEVPNAYIADCGFYKNCYLKSNMGVLDYNTMCSTQSNPRDFLKAMLEQTNRRINSDREVLNCYLRQKENITKVLSEYPEDKPNEG